MQVLSLHLGSSGKFHLSHRARSSLAYKAIDSSADANYHQPNFAFDNTQISGRKIEMDGSCYPGTNQHQCVLYLDPSTPANIARVHQDKRHLGQDREGYLSLH